MDFISDVKVNKNIEHSVDNQIHDSVVYLNVILLYISFCIGLFGIIANIINIIIFTKQGLNNTVNIGLLALAISDLMSLMTIEWYCLSFTPLLINSDIGFYPPDVQHLTAGTPHSSLSCITNWITAYITAERCLCVTSPIKVKRTLTPKRTLGIVSSIYILLTIPALPEYATAYFGPKCFPELNKTLIGLMFTEDRYRVDGVSLHMYAVLTLISFLAVIIFTFILVIKLRQQTKWRQMSTVDNSQSQTMSRRDKATVKMVIVVACIFMVSCCPNVAFFGAVFIDSEFRVTGKDRDWFLISAAFNFIPDTLNGSINIISYYTMSTKYRKTLNQMCSCLYVNKENYPQEEIFITNI